MKSFWARIPQEVKFIALSVGVVGVAVVLMKEPIPSTNQLPSSPPETPLSALPTPPRELLNTPLLDEPLPSPIYPLPQLSPPLKELGKDPLGVNPSPLPTVPLPGSVLPSPPAKGLEQPLPVIPSPGGLPNRNSPKGTGSTRGSSPSTSLPGIPPELLSPSPVTVPPSLSSVPDQKGASTETAGKKTSTNKNAVIAEVRNYFKKGWKPPSNLKEPLQYSVVLNADGTIQQILPLSNAAGEYINNTNLPLPGNSLASPAEEGSKTGVLLEFRPDGKVKASLEEVNLPSASPSSRRGDSSNFPPKQARP
ncbi:hypothetical protein [Allocoleopsis sp.]|uniref:hypothetical protein n=1 Tax=Allocoleopsis sp. TaxID=3088169 RepID=UPI002FCE7C12